MEWMHIAVFILAGSAATDPPSTMTVLSTRFATLKLCESDLLDTRLSEDAVATSVKASGLFVDGDYRQIIITRPVSYGLGQGFHHYSCIPVSGE